MIKTMQNWQLIRDGKLDKETFVRRARILDLMRENVDGKDVDIFQSVDHARVQDHIFVRRGSTLAGVRIEHVNGRAPRSIVDTIVF